MAIVLGGDPHAIGDDHTMHVIQGIHGLVEATVARDEATDAERPWSSGAMTA